MVERIALERRPAAFVQDILLRYRPSLLRIDQYDIGVVSGTNVSPPIDTKQLRRHMRHLFDHLLVRETAFHRQLQHRDQGVLDKRSSGSRLQARALLLLR